MASGMTQSILKQIADLQAMSQQDLKCRWSELFGVDPPAYRRGFLIRGLAQKIQELSAGGLPAPYRARLDTLIEDRPQRKRSATSAGPLLPGTKLVRDYNGITHEVTVTADGFEYGGRRYRSLSMIARQITNTRWNGWLFFGVPNPNKRERRSA